MVRLLNVSLRQPAQTASQKARGIYVITYSYRFQCNDSECEAATFQARISLRGRDPLGDDRMGRDLHPHTVACNLQPGDSNTPTELPPGDAESETAAHLQLAGQVPSGAPINYRSCREQIVFGRFSVGGQLLDEDRSWLDDHDEIYLRVHLVGPTGDASMDSPIVTGAFGDL